MDWFVTSGVIATVREEAEKALPHEACGLLLGTAGRITAAVACTNVAPDPARHFEIDPAALIAAHRAARAGGPQVLGHYHSHPSGAPAPSATDLEQGWGGGAVWAIAARGVIGWWQDAAEGVIALVVRVEE